MADHGDTWVYRDRYGRVSKSKEMHHIRRGKGEPLLLIHSLGGTWRSWGPILDGLAAEREVIAIDFPGFGETPPLPGEVSIRTLADAVTELLTAHNLIGIDAVDSSMAARRA
jgi:pimeloyl-ACP methyl ester carboxylesterase